MAATRIVITWSLFLLVAGWVPAASHAADRDRTVSTLGSIGMTVSDMDRSVAFYQDVLDFKKVSEVEVDGPEYDRLWGLFGVRARIVRMQLGEQCVELIEFLSPPDARPIPVPSYSNDLWFQHVAIVVRDIDVAWAKLRMHHVRQISPRPQTIPLSNRAAAGIKAIKFRDPDGHNLELLWFPEGKGSPIWRSGAKTSSVPGSSGQPAAIEVPPVFEPLFLGIDHTAITVRNTEHSTYFYGDLLGMTVAGLSLNMGTEQQYLDSLPDAQARVTGMKPATGATGVEFLEYESPAHGRPIPPDSHPTDLWHWQTTLVVSDVEAVAGTVHGMAQFLSSSVVTFQDKSLGFSKAVLVRDPDGHAVQLVQLE